MSKKRPSQSAGKQNQFKNGDRVSSIFYSSRASRMKLREACLKRDVSASKLIELALSDYFKNYGLGKYPVD
jgi:hypothetical protein